MTKRLIPLLLATSLLTACAVGPDYQAPQTATVAAAPFMGAAGPAFTGNAAADKWWTLYNDPVLTRMVDDALGAVKRGLGNAVDSLNDGSKGLKDTAKDAAKNLKETASDLKDSAKDVVNS